MSVEHLFPNGIAGARPIVSFDRRELTQILETYGRMVAAAEWRDYAIDMLPDRAVFSVFRRTAEHPLYRIQKTPRDAARQGLYAVIAMDGRILKRGRDLAPLMRLLEKPLIRPVE